MGEIQVVDRGAREIVVFLSGGFGTGDGPDPSTERYAEAVDEVDRLERIDGLDHVVVNMHNVTGLDAGTVDFLRSLVFRGDQHGFRVSFADVPGVARQTLHDAGWPQVP